MSRTSAPVVHHPARDFGAYIFCPSCGAQGDIWADACACGVVLLPDFRKVKVAKKTPTAELRMDHRASQEEQGGSPAELEQAVRDRVALRTREEQAGGSDVQTPRVIADLLAINRVDDACAEAEAVAAADIPEVHAFAGLAARLVADHDPRAEWWLARTIELMPRAGFIQRGTADSLPLRFSLIELLLTQDRFSDALPVFEAAFADLEARRKKSEKNPLFGSEAFAIGRWGDMNSKLESLREPVLEGCVKLECRAGQDALAEARRRDAAGDIAGALQAVQTAEARMDQVLKRLKPLGQGPARRALRDLTDMEPTLGAEAKRLRKAAKSRS